jgi:CRISPR-associated protein Cmr6
LREASPIHFHIARKGNGTLSIRAIVLPPSYLTGLAHNQNLLSDCLRHVHDDLDKRIAENARLVQNAPKPLAALESAKCLPATGESVRAILLSEKTKKGGWMARDTASGITGPIQNSAAVPPNYKPDDIVSLVVANRTDFKWPPPQQCDKPVQKKSGSKPPPGKGKNNR